MIRFKRFDAEELELELDTEVLKADIYEQIDAFRKLVNSTVIDLSVYKKRTNELFEEIIRPNTTHFIVSEHLKGE